MNAIANRKGQNTVEYLLMLTVVVGVVLVSGVALKKFMPGFFENVATKVTEAANRLGGN
jgi:Flp pilus assembly pilin Flp